jgi:RHS repeat-associated protein
MLRCYAKKYLLLCTAAGICTAVAAQQNIPNGSTRPTATAVPVPGAYQEDTRLNYVRTRTAAAPVKQLGAFLTAGIDSVKMFTEYMDGLGRAMQTVAWQTSPGKKDLVAPKIYDAFGRETHTYLPYASSSANGLLKTDPFAEQTAFMTQQHSGESIFYSENRFEASPLQRLQKTLAPGNSWAGADKGVSTQYLLNETSDSVQVWDISFEPGSIPVSTHTYAAAQLFETHTTDEENNSIVEYTDREGKVVLKKVQVRTTPSAGPYGWLCTYYIYDDLGMLRFVVPPKASEWLAGNHWTLSTTVIDELCFRYDYDAGGRMVAKKVPGTGWVYLVYDRRDRLVFAQDANLRPANRWLTTLYDNLNRSTVTGMIVYSGTRDALQATIDAQFDAGQPTSVNILSTTTTTPADTLFVQQRKPGQEVYTANGAIHFLPGFVSENGASFRTESGGVTAVTGTNIIKQFHYNPLPPGSTLVALTYTYYDDYSNTDKSYITTNNNKLDDGGNINAVNLPAAASLHTKGLVTGTRVRILSDPSDIGKGGWLETARFYDEKARPVQTQAVNMKGGKDISITRFDFTGTPITTYQVHTQTAASEAVRTKTNMQYDHAGRLVSIRKTFDDDNTTTRYVMRAEYDEMGQLKNKQLGQKSASDASAMEQLVHDYTIRGWLKGINKEYTGNTGDAWFGMELSYDHGFSKNRLDGNIGGMTWRGKGDGKQRAFGYGYDAANRLLFADFKQFDNGSWNNTAGLDFKVTMGNGTDAATAYDANGNIRAMQQKGWKPGGSSVIDQLSYNYLPNTNKLLNVIDDANDTKTKLGDFRTSEAYMEALAGSKAFDATDYTYDANGNLELDRNKDIVSITYNHLNLPCQVSVAGKGTITFIYDAEGNKLQKITREYEPSRHTITDYMAGAVYSNDTLQFLAHEEGRIRKKAGQYVYDYFIKDHLGNTRMVLTEEEQQDNYPAASMETAAAATENAIYSKVEETRIGKPAGYPEDSYTDPNAFVSKLNGNGHKIGTGIVLKVMSGDKFNIRANAWYPSGPTPGSPVSPLSDLLVALATGISSAGKDLAKFNLSELQQPGVLTPGVNDMLTRQSNDYTANNTRPKAYLNWILFDEQFRYVSGSSGFEQVGEAGDFKTWVKSNLPVSSNGYLYVYTSNESPVDVFFDNLQVSHVRGPLVEETHYYPFGLTMAGISSKAVNFGGPGNKYKSNGGTELENKEFSDGSGLDWLATDFRSYDAQIGRFHQVDFLSALSFDQSPFAFVNNNPISYVDPLGLDTLNMVNGKLPTTRPDGAALVEKDVILNADGSVGQTYNGEGWQATAVLQEVVVSNSPKNSSPQNSDPAPVAINFGRNANRDAVSPHTIRVLQDIMRGSGNNSLTITSTQRTPESQARAMYTNIINRGVQYNLNLYSSNGDRVVNVAARGRREGLTRDQILTNMVTEIRRIGPGRVSRHCGDPNILNVLDIAPSSLQNRRAFVREIRGRGIFLLQPPEDPAYHLEIRQ